MREKALIIALLVWGAAGCNRAKPPQQAQAGAAAQPSAAAAANTPDAPPVEGVASDAAALVIPAGAQVRVRLDDRLDTRRNRAGDGFQATLAAPITVNGRVAVPRGTLFHGRVIAARPSGRLKGRAVIELALVSFRLHGATYRVETGARVRTSNSHKKRNLALIGGGAGGGAAIGGIAKGGLGALIGAGVGAAAGSTAALITGKKNVSLPPETPLTFSLRNRVEVRG